MSASFKEKLDQLNQEKQSPGMKAEDDDVIAKQKPHNEPLSEEFFATLKENDVLKCLGMLKANPNLALDCDHERKTPLHWAAHLDQANMF